MVVESYAVIAVILLMAGGLARAGKHGAALLSLPLMGVPLFYVIGSLLFTTNLFFAAIGFLCAMILSLLFLRKLQTRRSRLGYFLLCLLFSAALLLAYSVNLN